MNVANPIASFDASQAEPARIMNPALDARFIVSFDTAAPEDHARMGGKCSGLARMTAHGVSVPAGFAVTTDAFAAHMKSSELAARLRPCWRRSTLTMSSRRKPNRRIRALIVAADMPPEVEASIRSAYQRLAVEPISPSRFVPRQRPKTCRTQALPVSRTLISGSSAPTTS